jgi:hypothetical protein
MFGLFMAFLNRLRLRRRWTLFLSRPNRMLCLFRDLVIVLRSCLGYRLRSIFITASDAEACPTLCHDFVVLLFGHLRSLF